MILVGPFPLGTGSRPPPQAETSQDYEVEAVLASSDPLQ